MYRPAATQALAPALPTSRSLALAALALAMLLSSLGTSVANVALPTLASDFGASFQAVQWVVLAYLLAVTTLVVSVGRLGDLTGRRRLMLGGIAVFALASIACGAATDLWVLIGARVAQGFGAAVMMALSMALVADTTTPERAGRAMGLLGTVSAAGTALGPSLGGVLIEYLGWPAIFLINVPLGLVAYVLSYRSLSRDTAVGATVQFDVVGSVLLALTLVAYALALTVGTSSNGFIAACLLVVALSGAGLFVIVQSSARSPLVRPQLFRNRVIRSGFAMSALVTTVAMTTLVVGPFYLSRTLHLSPAGVGLAMTAGPLVAALVGVPAGRGVDRYGARRMAGVGLLLMTAGCAALALVPSSAGVVGYVVPLLATTAGYATFQAANNTAVMAATQPAQRGVVSGLLNLSRNLGLITGASAMGAVFAYAAGTTNVGNALPGHVAIGMHTAFAVAAVLTGIAITLAVVTKPTLRND